MTKKFYKFLVKLFLGLHNISYKLVSKIAIRLEDGVHPKHRLMNYHTFFLDNLKRSDVVLDIGCGNGILTYDLAKKVKKVIGIDIDKENIKIARERYSASNIEYILGNALTDLPEQAFDAVVLSNILEHIQGRLDFLKTVKNLAPKILIRVPMLNRDWITLYKKELGIEWRLDKTHHIEYTLVSFKKELEKAGLEIGSFTVQFGEIWAVVFRK